jgi:hypothetical protein
VNYQVAKTAKPHTTVKYLSLPAATDMTGTMLGGKAKKLFISDVAGDVLKQLLLRIQASEFYALQLDE